MKTSSCLITLVALVLAAGCQAERTHVASQPSNVRPENIAQDSRPTYTVKIIPNPRLSATSREGDKDKGVYSSNMVAVYVRRPETGKSSITNENQIGEQRSK